MYFFRYETQNAPEGILKGVSDRFQGITVDSKEEACNSEAFLGILNSEYAKTYQQ
jgi:hypothetical protein